MSELAEDLFSTVEARFRAGDEKAFDAIFNQYRKEIFLFLRFRFCLRYEDADDLAEKVFTKAWIEHDKFDPCKGSMITWLRVLGKFAFLDFRRERKEHIEQPLPEAGSSSEISDSAGREFGQQCTSEDYVADSELIGKVRKRLSGRLWEVIELTYLKEMSDKEAAAILNIPVGTVGSRKSNALQQLRELEEFQKRSDRI